MGNKSTSREAKKPGRSLKEKRTAKNKKQSDQMAARKARD